VSNMSLNEADTRAKLIDPALYERGRIVRWSRRCDHASPPARRPPAPCAGRMSPTNGPDDTDQRTPEALLAIIDAKGREVEEALAPLRELLRR